MRRPVLITTPFPTPEETAQVYGISKRRANSLRKMVEESLAKKGYVFINEKGSPSNENGAKRSESRSRRLNVKVRANSKVKAKSGNASRRKRTRGKAKTSH